MGDVILGDGSVWRFDGGAGVWRHIPDAATANAMGVDWNDLASADAVPGPTGDDWPSVSGPGPAPQEPPAPPADVAPIGGGSSFVWGGRSWAPGDLAAFVGYLAAHGTSYGTWADNHPGAAAILEGPSSDPSREPVPKSVGEALGAAIAAGATPEEAAAQAAALAASQRAQGFGAPVGDQLLEAAKMVADNYAQAGGPPGGTGGGASSSTPSSDAGLDRYLAGDAIALDMADDFPSRELSGVTELPAKAWQDLRDQLVHDIPFVGNHVRKRGAGMRAPLASELWSGSS